MRPMLTFRRKKLVAVLVWTIVLTAAANAAADFWRLKYYRPRSPRWNLNAYAFQQAGERADILLLGSSRIRQGINATVVESVVNGDGSREITAYNAAQPATGMVVNHIMLRDLIRSNGCPEMVVLEVSPGSLNQNGAWWPTLGDYATVRDLPIVWPGVTSFERLDFVLVSTLRGGMRFYDRLARPPKPSSVARRLAAKGSLQSALAWRPEEIGDGPGKRSIRMARNLYRREFWRQLKIGGSTRHALRGAAAMAERCAADLVLVRMPTLIWYEAGDEQNVNAPFLAAVDEFLASHDAVFLDANTTDAGIEGGHFRDPVHLNRGGSIVFSEHLARQTLLPLL